MKADKIVNLIVKEEVVKTMDKTITATIRDNLGILLLLKHHFNISIFIIGSNIIDYPQMY